jgi:hypothetical protein
MTLRAVAIGRSIQFMIERSNVVDVNATVVRRPAIV